MRGALALLARVHVRDFSLSLGVDAVTGALAASAVAAAVLDDAVALSIEGDLLAVLTTLAYPVADVLLLGFVVGCSRSPAGARAARGCSSRRRSRSRPAGTPPTW